MEQYILLKNWHWGVIENFTYGGVFVRFGITALFTEVPYHIVEIFNSTNGLLRTQYHSYQGFHFCFSP